MKHKFWLLAVLVLAQCLWAVQFADASVVYTYTGDDFQYASSTSPYTPTDSITGSVTLSSALGASSSGVVAAVSFSFSVGNTTISTCSYSPSCEFSFATGSNGAIDYWFVSVTNETSGTSNGPFIISENYESGITPPPGFLSLLYPPYVSQDEVVGSGYYAYNVVDPGTWSGPISATPLPAALSLFASGLGVLGLLGWRRKRKAQAVTA